MDRPLWIGALVGMLAWTAACVAQAPQQDVIMTVREADKPPQKCRVLKSWCDKAGSKFYQVQDVNTGAILTIQDPSPNGSVVRIAQAGPSPSVGPGSATAAPSEERPSLWRRLFGPPTKQATAPATPTTPAPPADKAVASVSVQLGGKADSSTADDKKKAVVQAPPPAPEPSRPNLPLAAATNNDPLANPEPYMKQVPGLEENNAPDKAPAAKPEVTVLARIPAPPAGDKPSAASDSAPAASEKPSSPSGSSAPTPASASPTAPTPSRGLLSRLFGRPATAPADAPVPTAAPVATMAPSSTDVGKPTPASDSAAKPATTTPSVSPAPQGLLSRLFGHTPETPAPVSTTEPPAAAVVKPIPAADPGPKDVKPIPATEVVKAAPVAAPPAKGLLARLFGHSSDAPAVAVAEKPAEKPPARMPMGMSSILAVQSPLLTREEPVGQMVVVEGQAVILPGKTAPMPSIPVTASNAFTLHVPQGAMPASMATPDGEGVMVMQNAPMYQASVPEGMNNAFTSGGTTRPIPADNGLAYQSPNAFQQPGVSGAVRLPVMQPMPIQSAYRPAAMMPPFMPAASSPPMLAQQSRPATPAAVTPEAQMAQLVSRLRDALPPSEREMAAEQLARCDWRTNPGVTAALLTAAKTDPAATVRAGCVRALAKMKVNTTPVLQTVQALKSDSDVQVREEVVQALAVLTAP